MFCLMICLSLAFGTLSVGLISKSAYMFCEFFLIRFGGIKTIGTVIDYADLCYHTKQTPPRLIHNYFPIIEYTVFGKTFRSECKNIFRKSTKAYPINAKKEIYVNKKNNFQIIICGNYNFTTAFALLFFGILYLGLLNFFYIKLFAKNLAEYKSNALISFVISAISVLSIIIFSVLKGYVNNKKTNIYIFINCTVFILAFFAATIFR